MAAGAGWWEGESRRAEEEERWRKVLVGWGVGREWELLSSAVGLSPGLSWISATGRNGQNALKREVSAGGWMEQQGCPDGANFYRAFL